MDNTKNTLPEGWEMKTLVEVCDLITCGVAKKPEYFDEGIPFLSARNIKSGNIIWNNYKYISKSFHKELTKKNKPQNGDILYTRVGSYGEAAVVEGDKEFSIFVSLTLIKPKGFIDSYFLKNYLNSDEVKKLAKDSITSSGVGNLNVGTVRCFPIPIPPLQEQKRIVSILDELFENIDEAKKIAEENLVNAKKVFESYLQNVFEEKGEDWEEKKLGEVCGKITDGSHNPPKGAEIGGMMLSGRNIGEKGLLLDKVRFLSEKDFNRENKRTDVQIGDVLLSIVGTIGRSLVYTKDEPKVTFQRSVALFKSVKENSFFLNYYFKSSVFQKILVDKSRGVAQKGVYLKTLRELNFIFPKSLEKQKEIVEVLDKLSGEVEKLEKIYKEKSNKLEELKKSVLQEAFSGKL